MNGLLYDGPLLRTHVGSSAIPDQSDPNFDVGDIVDRLDQTLRGEISATETYDMTLAALRPESPEQDIPAADRPAARDEIDPLVATLCRLRAAHAQHVRLLRQRIRELGGAASDDGGVWALWARAVTGTANLFGPRASLKALKEGEEHGLSEYDKHRPHVDEETQALLDDVLIPETKRHIHRLETLLARGDLDE